mmetsp:Transcript_115341/g.325949  ORF Transcript_115341/g.325949 Transcript_115341/m.325949 type:complete len:209 (+) Transcript_115341:185-811(+)
MQPWHATSLGAKPCWPLAAIVERAPHLCAHLGPERTEFGCACATHKSGDVTIVFKRALPHRSNETRVAPEVGERHRAAGGTVEVLLEVLGRRGRETGKLDGVVFERLSVERRLCRWGALPEKGLEGRCPEHPAVVLSKCGVGCPQVDDVCPEQLPTVAVENPYHMRIASDRLSSGLEAAIWRKERKARHVTLAMATMLPFPCHHPIIR